MTPKTPHWTEENVTAFRYRIATDFAVQIEKKMSEVGLKRKGMASGLKVSSGRVSQVLNDPGNFSLDLIIRYARVLGMKVAIVAYDDKDPHNNNGPINPEIFQSCWEKQGRPRDFFDLEEQTQAVESTVDITVTRGLGKEPINEISGIYNVPDGGSGVNLDDKATVPVWLLKEWGKISTATCVRTID